MKKLGHAVDDFRIDDVWTFYGIKIADGKTKSTREKTESNLQ